MPAPFGVTATGFKRPTLLELIALCEADELGSIDAAIDVSSDALVGQLNGIYCRQLDIAWEALEEIYFGNDPDRAEDDQLVSLAKLTGTERRAATNTIVVCTVTADDGTVLTPDVHYAALIDHPDVLFTPLEEFTAVGDGAHANVKWRAKDTGPVSAPGTKLTVITTAVVGWHAITNPLSESSLGRPVDDDPTLRTQREERIANAAGATVAGIAAAILKVAGVQTVLPFENSTPASDANGLPPNSFEMVIWDGAGLDAANNDIAQAIWNKKGSGARPYGTNASGTAKDANGDDQLVAFTRSTQLLTYLTFDLEVAAGFDSTAFKTAVALAANEIFTGGKDVLVARLIAIALDQPKVEDVNSVLLGLTASPTGTVNLVVTPRQIGRFDSVRIVETH